MGNQSTWDKLENSENRRNNRRAKTEANRQKNIAKKKEKFNNRVASHKGVITLEDMFINPYNLSRKQIMLNKGSITTANKYKAELIKRATDSEKIMYKYLLAKGVKFEFQKILYIHDNFKVEKFYIADFCFNDRLIIELDGGYHDNPEQIELDNKRTAAINKLGYKVFRYSNDKTYNMDLLWANVTKYYKNL